MLVMPTTPEELASAMGAAGAAGLPIRLNGATSKPRMAGYVPDAATEIRTTGLTRILEYEPRDLTISVEAGIPWAALQSRLLQDGMMIPLDPPFFELATAGGVAASNTCGPRRRLYGGPRDHVIGMRFAALDGKLIQSGGMVVKNVAGLDIGKLMIGSFGTLAAIAVINFKLTPVPESSKTFLYESDSAGDILARRDAILKSVLQPCALDILHSPSSHWTLALQAAGTSAVTARYMRELTGWSMIEADRESAFWRDVREFVPDFLSRKTDAAIVRLSHTLSDLRKLVNPPGPLLARAGNGITYIGFDGPGAAGRWLLETGLPGVIEHSQPGRCAPEQLWPAPGGDFPVMRRVKEMLDPKGLLNPGRLYGRI
jgi:glycolate oxidase FAD binding subunit